MSLYLITGAAGFIGSALVRALLERGHRIRGLDNFSTGKRENLDGLLSKIDLHEGDLLDEAVLRDACTGVDFILHQAAIPSVPRSIADPIGTHNSNVNGTLHLLTAARDAQVKRVIYAASSSAYGDTETLPKHEEMPTSPISPYGAQKLTGEFYMTAFHRVYGMETVSLRYFNIFGPRQDSASPYSGVLAKFIMRMLHGEAPTIYGDGEQSRDFTYIDNAVQANLRSATAPAEKVAGRVFNIATGRRFTLNQTVDILKNLTGFTGKPNYEPPRAGDIQHSLADISRAREAFSYEPAVGFEEGLKRTVQWYSEQMARELTTNSSAG
jgi:UDP-glucose 4-epimerase